MQQDMSTAMFRTLSETMGMEQAWIAETLGVGIRSVARWHSPRHNGTIPVFAQDWITGWWERFQAQIGQVVDQFAENIEDHDDLPLTVVTRYGSEEAYRAAPDYDETGMTWSMHSALVGLLVSGLEQEGVTALVEWKR